MTPVLKIYLGTIGYGGLAHADFMTALLAFRLACKARGVRLMLDMVGGEALICRGHAVMLAKFLISDASHLLLLEADRAFEGEAIFRLLDAGEDLATGDHGMLLISRRAAERLDAAYPELVAHIEAGANAGVAQATMVFDPFIEDRTGRYLYDHDALQRRWRELG